MSSHLAMKRTSILLLTTVVLLSIHSHPIFLVAMVFVSYICDMLTAYFYSSIFINLCSEINKSRVAESIKVSSSNTFSIFTCTGVRN